MPVSSFKKEMEVITLPDYTSLAETSAFITYLQHRSERFGIKKLLYHTEMIESHLKRIQGHVEWAHRVLIRVNGDITPMQKQQYAAKIERGSARKFYASLNDDSFDDALEMQGIEYAVDDTKEELVEKLVEAHMKRDGQGYKG